MNQIRVDENPSQSETVVKDYQLYPQLCDEVARGKEQQESGANLQNENIEMVFLKKLNICF